MRKYSPKTEREERDYGYVRIVGHAEVVGEEVMENGKKRPIHNHCGGILDLKRPKQADLWWARKFLKSAAANPLTDDEKHSALLLLDRLNKKWPETDVPEKNGKPDRELKRGHVLVLKAALRGCRKKLKEAKNKLAYWEPRYAKMPFSNKRWKEVHEKVNELREEVVRLANRITHLEEQIGK